jgi:hypothetical protein
MSYVDQPTYELGRRAFEVTLENIQQRGNFLPQHITLPTTLVLCDTCTKKQAKPSLWQWGRARRVKGSSTKNA